jgi:hypothetical protein
MKSTSSAVVLSVARAILSVSPSLLDVAPPVCPRQDSNLRTTLRRRVLYPLSYGGSSRG